jgi:predicted kinase
MKSGSTKLIVLRGPSGSGKSTLAKKLFASAKRRTALIEQDHYRFIFNPSGGGSKANSDTIHKMIIHDTLICLESGYDVILEGILSEKSYGRVLDDIFVSHPEENYMFYFDISLDETLKRHETRGITGFGEPEMREWYPSSHRSGHELERVIPEDFTIEESYTFIKDESQF